VADAGILHNKHMSDRQTSGPSDYLAAERTLLAWIRTGLALMGFGFVVARFGLFLQALQSGRSNYQAHTYGPSLWFGTGLIVLGVIVNFLCAWNHIRLVRQLERGGPIAPRVSTSAMSVAIILAILGLAMAVYLVAVPGPILLRPQTGREQSGPSNLENGIVTIPSFHRLMRPRTG